MFRSNCSAIKFGAYYFASAELQSCTRTQFNLQYMANTSLRPQLVTFELATLHRCLCFSELHQVAVKFGAHDLAALECLQCTGGVGTIPHICQNAMVLVSKIRYGGDAANATFFDVVSFSNPLSFEVIWGTQPGIGPAITMMWLRARKVQKKNFC